METSIRQTENKVSISYCKVGKRYCKSEAGLCDPEAESFMDRCTICNKTA